jgi:hypothetical protein
MHGVSGTFPINIILIFRNILGLLHAVTLLTMINNISNSQCSQYPNEIPVRKLKPFEGFRFQRKGFPSLTIPINTAGARGLLVVSDYALLA